MLAMRYIRKIFIYIFENFRRTILPVLPSAILLGIFYRQTTTLMFIKRFSVTDIRFFGDIFSLLFSSNATYYFLLLPIMFVFLCFSCSYLLAMVYKHFRTGKITMRMPLSSVNHGLETVGIIVSIIFIVMLVYKLLFSCVLSLVITMFPPRGMPSSGMIAFTCIFGIVTYFSVIYFLVYPIMAASVMLVYGYSFKDAMSESLHIRNKDGFYEVLIGYMFPFCVNIVVSYILVAASASATVFAIVNTVLELFAITYLVLFSIIVVFDKYGIERVDIKKLY